jgi:hypothetical protein
MKTIPFFLFKEETFHDVKTNETSEDLPMKKLLFTFKSEGKNFKHLFRINIGIFL